jgi:polysaccharide biosynthesis transport protein
MLHFNEAPLLATNGPQATSGLSFTEILVGFKGFLRRQSFVFLVIIGCTTALALAYLLVTPPTFTASASIVIDTRKVQVLPNQAVLGDMVVDPSTTSGTVATEIEILRSRSVSLSVIKQLQLENDPEFVGGGLLSSMAKFIPFWGGSKVKPSEAQMMERILRAFENRRTVARVGQTYVIEIDFRSLDPIKCARIANAIANAYVSEQLEAKYDIARLAGTWFQDRAKELKTQVFEAEQDVANFKRANNIVETGKGERINEQEVSELNTQLILAAAATSEAKARLDRIQNVMRQAVPDASVADAQKNEVIIRLRNQYLENAAKERIYESRYGVNHLATINLRTQLQELQQNINDEMKKIAESYKSDYEIASAREESLKNSLARVVSKSQDTNQAEIRLRELESKAQSYSNIYQNFRQRSAESAQQESFPIADSRLTDRATPPANPSDPKPFLVLAISMISGLFLSSIVGYYRECSDPSFRTSKQIKQVLGINSVATLPTVKLAYPSAARLGQPTAPAAPRTVVHTNDLLRNAVDSPFSQFAEGIRAVKVMVDLKGVGDSDKVIGVTSTLPDEGKSTVTSNLAHLIAHAGERAILIDCDLRNPTLSLKLSPHAQFGLVDVVAGEIELADALWTEPTTGLKFLPAGATSKLSHTNNILASEALKNSINRLLKLFDYVIVDLPPLTPLVDTRCTTNFITSYIYVVEWGRTETDIAVHVLAEAREIYDRLVGVVMNKVDLNVASRYEGRASLYKYRKYYSRYTKKDFADSSSG